MSLQPSEQIGAEVQTGRDQSFGVDVSIDGQARKIENDDNFAVSAGTGQNPINRAGFPKYYTRIAIAALMFMMVNAAFFGVELIVVLTVPALTAHENMLVPAVVVVGTVLAVPVSWIIAPRLRARYWRQRDAAAAL